MHDDVWSPPTIAPFLTTQVWQDYTAEQHLVWRELYRRRMTSLPQTVSRVYLEGMAAIGIAEDRLPDLRLLNSRLRPATGWAAVAVSGFIPAAEFFASLAARRFPTTITIRPMDRLDYVPEPDIFHDVFGHVPLHAHPNFANYLQRFGAVAAKARSPEAVTAMARLFWFTVEFGLVVEDGDIRIYGSGLISSGEDAANSLGPACDRRPFSLEAVAAQPFEIDRLQDVLFVVEDFSQLEDAMADAAALVARLDEAAVDSHAGRG